MSDNENLGDLEILEQEENETVTVSQEEVKKLKDEQEKIKQALAKANKEAKERRLALKALEDAGLSIEDAIKLKEKHEEEEQASASRKGDVEKIREQLQAKYDKEMKSRDDIIEKQKKTIYDFLVSSRAAEALNALGAIKGAGKVIMPHVQKHTQVLEEDGKYVVRIVDEDGDTKFNDNGEFMSIQEYLEKELKADEVFGNLFVATQHSGGGSKSGGGKGGDRKLRKSTFSRVEKTEFIAKNGYGAWAKLPE